MSDDWRLRIDLGEHRFARRLGELLDAEETDHGLERAFDSRVVVSVADAEVFCYAGSREQAQRTEELVRKLAAEHGWPVELELSRWHPAAERWDDPDVPMPAADDAAERSQRIAGERAESQTQGYPEFEVRVQCRSRGDAGVLAERLEREGVPSLHRFSYVLIGATDEDSAEALAQRLRGEVPDDTTVTVERNRRAIYDQRIWSPFAVLGGLAG